MDWCLRDITIPMCAVRLEGTSKQYVIPEYSAVAITVALDTQPLSKALRELLRENLYPKKKQTW